MEPLLCFRDNLIPQYGSRAENQEFVKLQFEKSISWKFEALDSDRSQKRCLAINAAFLKEIKVENRFLDELLLATRDALTNVAIPLVHDHALVNLLRRLRDRLAMHFSLEESYGYFKNALEFPIEWSTEAIAFRHQHITLYQDVCEIVEASERLLDKESNGSRERSIQRITSSFAGFYRKLRQHNSDEYALIEDILSHAEGGESCSMERR